jgi:hypothetical protein
MERFVVLKNGGIYNLTSNKKLEVDIAVNKKKIDLSKMSDTMNKSFSVMQRKEFIENWILTLSLMLKNDIEDPFDNGDDDKDENLLGDLECSTTSATGDDVTNYVTAFIIGRMFGKFEKNTESKVEIKETDICTDELNVIDDFIKELENEISIAESLFGNGYFEFDNDDEETEDDDGFGKSEFS